MGTNSHFGIYTHSHLTFRSWKKVRNTKKSWLSSFVLRFVAGLVQAFCEFHYLRSRRTNEPRKQGQLRRAFIKDFLSSLKSNSALPSNTRLIIIWCGSHIRLRRLIQSTQCSFPIYADPNGLVYQLLEKSGTAVEMDSNRLVSRHAPGSATGTLTNLVQSAKLIKEVNPLKHGGARPDIGTAFLFESAETVKMSWSYRIASVSAQPEADVIRRVLGIESCAEEKEVRSMASTRDSKRLIRVKTFESEKKNVERSLRSICGLPAACYAHRRTVSCAEGFQTWRPRISCLACWTWVYCFKMSVTIMMLRQAFCRVRIIEFIQLCNHIHGLFVRTDTFQDVGDYVAEQWIARQIDY